jgi:hypothetical protein
MADGDVLKFRPAPGWWSAHRILAGGGTEAEVARAAGKALGKTLREGGGLPCLPVLADAVRDFAEDPSCDVLRAMARLRSIERSFAGLPLAMLGSRAASRFIAALNRGETVPSDLAPAIAEKLCTEILNHHLFSRALPELVGKRFASDAEASAWRERCLAAFDDVRVFRNVAAQLVRDNSGKRLQVRPSRSDRRRSTAELLGIGLE